jgi:protein-tyrosine phosphatase
MDDGSHTTAESIMLLQMLCSQGVKTAVATPHYYANAESIEEFLKRRQAVFNVLQEDKPEYAPKVILGAEVKYFHGISKMPNLQKLMIEGTDLLLLEMPMRRWTQYMISEITQLSAVKGITVVLAHYNRYLKQQSKDLWDYLYKNDIVLQANAEFFTDFSTRRKAIAFLKQGIIPLIGSDCHNLKHRPPKIGTAYEIIKKRTNTGTVEQILKYADSFL